MNVLDQITAEYKKSDIPAFNVGDTVKVHIKIKEGARERIQIFEGFVLKKQSGGISETFTVRRLASGVGVEKTFPLHSPRIDKIEVVKRGNVRRAKLNYMRKRTGKSARIKTKFLTQEQIDAHVAAEAAAAAEAEAAQAELQAAAEAAQAAAEEAEAVEATEATEAEEPAGEPAAEVAEESADEPAAEETEMSAAEEADESATEAEEKTEE